MQLNFKLFMFLELAYMPCLAHNLQLVIKDGLKISDDYNALIQHVAQDIVSKTKSSSIIAAELRKLNKKLNKKNLTRWNSMFMIRSVLQLSPDQMSSIRKAMPTRCKSEREIKSKFDPTLPDRRKLEEIQEVLEMFEFVTDEFQSNRVNFSRVYPAIMFLRQKLSENHENFEHTASLRKELLNSLNKRFGKLLNDDIFMISTFLDPNFGISAFEEKDQDVVKAKIISLLKISEAKEQVLTNATGSEEHTTLVSTVIQKRKENYIKYKPVVSKPVDKLVDVLNNYIEVIEKSGFEGCSLQFWKTHESRFKNLAEIARKYLGIPASSAGVERMFNISGHVLSCKRKK